ncbi:Charged multivesicular body protein 4b [Trichinella zimbabwensis]|uniref:Charged multivesicular body protein 4b n=1 Tax=Trichinella zimbabwensis TaxID=268475 RepID=A0A0V1GXX2_9BILA|nr:Charged multivesicular body protein 4b [Trichinella zimbabwensis]
MNHVFIKKFVPANYKLPVYSYCKKYHLDFLFIIFCFTMAWFSRVFGGNSKKRDVAPTPQEAIQRLRETEEMLVKKQEYLEKKIESEVATAKRYGTKNKRLALHALKRKKQYEKQLQQIDGTLATIEFQREALENASTNTEVLNVMGHAAKALKAAHNNMDVDKVHDLMDDISEQQDVANEISEAISNPIGLNQDVDEDDLMAELEELEQEELDKQLLNVAPTPKLPDVPTTTTPEVKESSQADSSSKPNHEEDEVLKELKAWAYTAANVTVPITNAYRVQQFHHTTMAAHMQYTSSSHGDTVPNLIGGSCPRWHQIQLMSQKYTEDKRCAAIITSAQNDKSRVV